MDKNTIKEMLRESLINEKSNPIEKKAVKTKDGKDRQEASDYDFIKKSFDKVGGFKMCDIMHLAFPDWKIGDKSKESYFGKLVNQEDNGEGSVHKFSDKQRARVIAAINTAKK